MQIDLVRFNPSNERVEVGFMVSDITATEGRDYFAPGSYALSFGPGPAVGAPADPIGAGC